MDISREQVLQIHQQNINSHQHDHSYQHKQLMDILGGMDNILTIALSCDDINLKLSKDQLNQIYALITTTTAIHPSNTNLTQNELENKSPKKTS